ncbi:conserved hypothetical protein [Aspergillus fumigatus A1163]|uniref:Uncharacterized protein n=1 Tax=Aspergillus fumigatus (strain CBS 144.89 / FGSC A1163 / CEA10) TaxID=451804 RepID=B0YE42_ASPFC|nr:conserved hypothetical protein [Aspergillus fumigatus A1163]
MDSVKQHADKTPLPPDSTELGLARSDTSLTIETEYVRMLLELQDIHWLYNFMASLAAWMLLAGYLVIPGTFTSLQKSDTITNKVAQNEAEKAVLKTIQNPPLVAIAWVLLSIGVATMSFLFYRWRRNYLWLISRLFMGKQSNAPQYGSRPVDNAHQYLHSEEQMLVDHGSPYSRSQRTTCRFICWANGRLQILET